MLYDRKDMNVTFQYTENKTLYLTYIYSLSGTLDFKNVELLICEEFVTYC